MQKLLCSLFLALSLVCHDVSATDRRFIARQASLPRSSLMIRKLSPTAFYSTKKYNGYSIDSSNRVAQANDLFRNGYHLTQTTDANKPLISRGDNRENLFTGSEDFSTTYWPTQEGVTYSANATTNPVDGAATADSIVETSATSAHRITRQWTSVGKSYRMSVYYKKIGSSAANDNPRVVVNAEGGQFSDFVISTGAVSAGATLQTLADGWYRLISAPFTVVAGTPLARISLNQNGSYAGDGTTGAYLFGVQLHDANSDLTYIPTTTFPQYRGISGNRVLISDGVNDYLSSTDLASVFTGADKPLSIVALVQSFVAANTKQFFGIGNSSGAAQQYTVRGRLNGKVDDAATHKLQTVGTLGTGVNVFSVLFGATTLNMYENGTLLGSADFDIDVGALTLNRASYGATLKDTSYDHWNGKLGPVAVFNKALISKMVAKLNYELKRDWRIN